MAGHIVKIMIEDTHPPVWRRVIVPEKITFTDMHEIIQILFDWEDMHLHNFTIPPKYITIDDEDSTLLEQFLLTNKWMRYTYDFGDEWRHRIIYEKTDESYEKRHATLVKSRGDNFEEDCGGIWSEEEYLNRKPFDSISAGLRLSALSFPVREGNQNVKDPEWLEGEDLEKFFRNLADKFMQNMEKALQHKETAIKDSRMRKKAEKWDKFIEIWHAQMCVHKEDDGYVQMTIPGIFTEDPSSGETMQKEHTLEIVSGNKTQKQLLADLNIAEAADYCKYLRIPLDNIQELKQMNAEIADLLKSNPEYILYVMDETEYQELLEWLKLPLGNTKQAFAETDTIFKAIALGLADFSMQKIKGYQRAKLSFASDIQEILSALDKKRRKKIYKETNTFTERMQALLLVYGVVEIEKLRELYIKIYREETEREHFLRLLYWHARFTEKLHTFYFLDGTGYASLTNIDAAAVLKKMDEFAADQEYVLLSAGELKKFAGDIWADNDWKSIVYSILYYHSDAPQEILERAFGKMLLSVFNGETLQEVLKPVFDLRILKESELSDICKIWTSVSGMMLEQRLPMLKGRSRMGYAEEKDISPWQVGMVSDENMQGDFNTGPMCGFPAEIQEMMYQAVSFADRNAMRELLRYKNRNHVRSEEFLYLLAEAYVTGGDNKKAERLIRELEGSSERGKAAAGKLREELECGEDIWEDYDDVCYDDNLTFGGEDLLQDAPLRPVWNYDQEPQQMPYVRESPKIGRNDPCPCGSGKKYKKCCGKR